MHNLKVNSKVMRGNDRATIVGLCLPNEWDNEPRYGIELLDKKEVVTYSDGSIREFAIIEAVPESALSLISSPIEEEEEVVRASLDDVLQKENPANAAWGALINDVKEG